MILPIALAVPLALASQSGGGAGGTAGGDRSQTIQVDSRSLLTLAQRMEAAGQTGNSEAIYRSMLSDRDRRFRNEARFRLSGLLAKREEHKEAALLLRDLLAEQPDASAARLRLAELLMAMGNEAAARHELRALQADRRLPTDVARMIDRWSNALIAQRPYGFDVSLALAPDSNINRATRSDTLGTIIGDFDISDDGKAKTGTGIAFQAQAFDRIRLSNRANIVGRAITAGNLYKDKDYRDIGVDFLVGPEMRIGSVRLNAEAGIGRRWYGGRHLSDIKRLGLDLVIPVNASTQLRTTAGLAKFNNYFNDLQDGTSRSVALAVDHHFTPALGATVNGSLERFHAADPGYSNHQWHLGMAGWRDAGPVLLLAGVSVGRLRADERLVLFPEVRRDRNLTLHLGMTSRRWRWQQFAPSIRISREWNHSSVEIYDFRRTRLEFGVARAF